MVMDMEAFAEQLAHKYQFSNDMLRVIIEAIPANVFFKDTECRYQMASHICSHLSGDIIGKTDLEVQSDPELGKFFYADDQKILETREGNQYISEMVFDGAKYYYEIIKKPVYNIDGSILGIIGLVNDVTEMKRLQYELFRIGITDKLTGVYNRTYFEQKVEQLVSDGYSSLSVIICDSNGLKFFNDTFSHKNGDKLLIETAQMLKNIIGDAGDIMRTGGDEFTIFCPDRSDDWCRHIIAKLKQAEKEISIAGLPISNAYGYAISDGISNNLEEAIGTAEKKMYSEKAKEKPDYISTLRKLVGD